MAINVTWLQDGGYTAAQDRTEQTAMLTKQAVVSVRPGIIQSDGTDATVTAQGTPNMTVNVSPFQAIIPDANGRAYIYTSDASVVSPTFATASGSHPRIDLLIARVYDNTAGDSAATTSLTLPGSAGSITVQSVTGTVEIVEGTPNASPTAPALPNSRCIILACVTVPTSASSIVTGDIAASGGGASRATYTVGAGAVLPTTGSADYPSASYEGAYIDDASLNGLLRWSGSAWVPVTTDSGWIVPAMGNSWANLGGANATIKYRLKNGSSYVEGVITGGTTGTLFTLPAGMRPLANLFFLASSNFTGAAYITVTSAGVVAVGGYISGGSNSYVGIAFDFIAEQ